LQPVNPQEVRPFDEKAGIDHATIPLYDYLRKGRKNLLSRILKKGLAPYRFCIETLEKASEAC